MRFVISSLIPVLALAQTYFYDADGRRVTLPNFQEQRQTQVLSDGPDGKVIEETITRKDTLGNPMPPQKIRTITRTGPSGEKIEERLSYEADFNGRMALQEKTTVVATEAAGRTNTNTTVEKADVNGGLQAFEKVAAEKYTENGKELTNRAIYRLGVNGQFAENSRERIEKVTENGLPKETVSTFESVSTGKLIMSRQQTTVAIKNPDGSTTDMITIYGVDAPGRTAGGPLKVREQQILTKRPGDNNTIVESLAIRRPNLNDGKLGEEIKVGERITKAPPPPAKPAQP